MKKKKQTIPEIVEAVKIEMCEKYCKWPILWDEEKEEQELIDAKCVDCPLGRLG